VTGVEFMARSFHRERTAPETAVDRATRSLLSALRLWRDDSDSDARGTTLAEAWDHYETVRRGPQVLDARLVAALDAWRYDTGFALDLALIRAWDDAQEAA
jgi:hypothetical protein